MVPSSGPVRKAVILAAGMGTRMKKADATAGGLAPEQSRAADAGLKAMIPFERPFLDYVLTPLCDAGIEQVCLVVAPGHAEIRNYYNQPGITRRLKISFAVQDPPRGTADAVLAAEDFVGQDGFLLLNSDNYYPAEAAKLLCGLTSPGVVVYPREVLLEHSNIPADRIGKYAVVKVSADDRLEGMIEKPTEEQLRSLPQPILISMNSWRFDPQIFAACRGLALSPRGELELPDAVLRSSREFGVSYLVRRCGQAVFDLSSRSDIAPVAALLRGKQVRI